jgi:hypothetical protein
MMKVIFSLYLKRSRLGKCIVAGMFCLQMHKSNEVERKKIDKFRLFLLFGDFLKLSIFELIETIVSNPQHQFCSTHPSILLSTHPPFFQFSSLTKFYCYSNPNFFSNIFALKKYKLSLFDKILY